MSRAMVLVCDSCSFYCYDMRDADQHEDENYEHWVQWTQRDEEDE